MKNKKFILSITVMLGAWAFWSNNALAATWYVRDGGGTAAQCTGTTNAVYPGSGSGQACAFNNPRYALGWDMDNPQAGKMAGGDTLYIDGDSDINPGQQAQYVVGYDDTGANGTPDCSPYWPYDCTLNNIPGGISASQPTSIIGSGSHKPQLWGNERVWQVLEANNNYITLQNLEITDHDACAYNDPSGGCNYGGPYPYGAWSEDGIVMSGTGITLTNVYVHGLGRYGINTGNMGSATFNSVWVIGNGYGGVTVGNNGSTSVTGTLTFNQPIIEWNGCVEAYPVVGGIDNPSNYSNCFGQNSAGYGDGLAFGASGNENAGNWTIIGPGSISFNTQDGLDTLHGNGNGTILIDKMRFEGNAGNQVKMNALSGTLTNSIVIADCGWWYGAPQSLAGGMLPGDSCRALGNAISYFTTAGAGTTDTFYNNTILSNGNIVFLQNNTCDATTKLNVKNNVIVGGYNWIDDTSFNSSGGNSKTTLFYNGGTDGDGTGCSGNMITEDYNLITGTANNNTGCSGAHDKCGASAGFSGSIAMGTAGGNQSTYYTGQSASNLVSLTAGSAAIAAGVSGLTYWNNENDYHNVIRTSPPSIGALEMSSCAANGYGCFFNTDCCSGTCSNMSCGTASAAPQPVVSITSPASTSSFSEGSNITISALASESNGTITNISLYNGSTLLSSSSTSPFNYVMSNAAVGTYNLTAKATDANGVSVTSVAVTMTVTAQSVVPSAPVVTITSPTSGSSITAGSNLTVTTAASETNGTISNIALYNGSGVLLGSSSTSPFNFVDTNMLAGSYSFYAVATDANGVSVTSSAISVTVAAAPVVPSSPVVAMTGPANGSTYTGVSNITLTATASETNGSIASVIFYNGTVALGYTGTSSPYTYTWNNVQPGSYTLTAKATDANGVVVASSPVTITVNAAPTGVTPVVAITSPANGATFAANSNIALSATATEANGSIILVQFFNGTIPLSYSGSKSPYTYTWKNVQSGTYTMTAQATDFNGVVVASTPVTIYVGTSAPTPVDPEITSPSNGSTFTAGTNLTITANASETNGTISMVSFYNGSTLLGTSTSSPYSYTWNNIPAGNYSLTVKATDSNGNVGTSAPPVSITVTAPPAPIPPAASSITLTAPVNNASYTVPASIVLTSSATDTSASIARVDYYAGSIYLGEATSSPFTLTWTSAQAGTYALTAKATDSNGNVFTSAAVNITVNAHTAPTVSLTAPANNASYTPGSNIVLTANASANGGSISKVDFYNGSLYLGTAYSSPYTLTWSNVQAGTYSLTAKATDSYGWSSTSTAVTVTVAAVAPPVVTSSSPVVTLTSLVSAVSFTAGSNITLSATASEVNGNIVKVQLFNGSVLLNTDTRSPYSFTLKHIQSGIYVLTAQATDSNGVVATSTPIVITVIQR